MKTKIKQTAAIPAGWQPGQPLPVAASIIDVPRTRVAISDDDWIIWDDLVESVVARGFRDCARVIDEGWHTEWYVMVATSRGMRPATKSERVAFAKKFGL